MSIRTVRYQDALATIRSELVYSTARLKAEPKGSDLAPALGALLARVGDLLAGQLAAWDAEDEAQARVDRADDDLDDALLGVERALLHVERGDRSTARFRRYFPHAPSALVRLGLESELTRVRELPASLAKESEQELRDAGEALAAAVASGDTAVRARSAAAGSRADHRTREIAPFVDDVNAARRSIYGELVRRAAEQRLARDWPDRFFRHAHRGGRGGAIATDEPAEA